MSEIYDFCALLLFFHTLMYDGFATGQLFLSLRIVGYVGVFGWLVGFRIGNGNERYGKG